MARTGRAPGPNDGINRWIRGQARRNQIDVGTGEAGQDEPEPTPRRMGSADGGAGRNQLPPKPDLNKVMNDLIRSEAGRG